MDPKSGEMYKYALYVMTLSWRHVYSILSKTVRPWGYHIKRYGTILHRLRLIWADVRLFCRTFAHMFKVTPQRAPCANLKIFVCKRSITTHRFIKKLLLLDMHDLKHVMNSFTWSIYNFTHCSCFSSAKIAQNLKSSFSKTLENGWLASHQVPGCAALPPGNRETFFWRLVLGERTFAFPRGRSKIM